MNLTLDELRQRRPMLMHTESDADVVITMAKFLAKHFIARRDVKAIQRTDILGAYAPINHPWVMRDFENHFSGKKTYGHYIVNSDQTCKLFAFDIDLKKIGMLPTILLPQYEEEMDQWYASFEETNLREAWLNRGHVARDWMKMSMREIASLLARGIDEVEVPHLISYTGSKGLHVYALTGLIPSQDAYDAAHLVIETLGGFELSKGNVFYQWTADDSPEYALFEIEAFPKQVEINEDGYGNLLRLPYGINLRAPKDRTFFIDETLPLNRIEPASIGQILDAVN